MKQVGFKIVTTLSYSRTNPQQTKTRFKNTKEEFIWAPNAGSCLSSDKNKSLSLSGSGPSSKGTTIYNSPIFAKKADTSGLPDPLEGSFKEIHAQQGSIDSEGRQITTDVGANVAAWCNETTYRCPIAGNDPKRIYEALDLALTLDFKPDSNKGFSKSSSLTPKLTIKKGSFDVGNLDIRYSMDGVPGDSFEVASTHGLEIKAVDKGSKNATKMCRQICKRQTNFNRIGTRYKLGMDYYLGAFKSGGSINFDDDTSIKCTACYMKSCGRFGLGTFGPMDKQPNQPLDATIPECWLQYSEVQLNPSITLDSVFTPNRRCVSAKVSFNASGTPKIRYKNEKCNRRLPVMCFNYGSFRLAKRKNSEQLVYRPQRKAARTCFEMGYESVRRASLDGAILSSNSEGPMPEGNASRYRFYNLAQQGIFLSPHLDRDLKDYVRWAQQNGIRESTEFWVALDTYQDPVTNKVRIKASTPFIANKNVASNAGADENNAIYYDSNGVMRNKHFGFDLSDFAPRNDATGRMIVHSVKYKGVAKVNAGNNLRSLCYNPNTKRLFLSSKRSNYSSAPSICQGECTGCRFPRLGSPLDWVRALNLVQRNTKDLPFPDPKIDSAQKLGVAWVYSDE